MAILASIEGISRLDAEKLRIADIRTTDDLLRECATPAGRKLIAEFTGINEKRLLRYTHQADLLRIKGVGGEYADLLEAGGVGTVIELARHDAEHLLETILEVNAEKRMVRQLPGIQKVENWIQQARQLPPMVRDEGD